MSIPFKSDIELNKIVSNDLDLEINSLKLNGSTGTEGQVLTSTGGGAPIWSTVGGGSGGGTSGTTTHSLTITLNGTSTSFDGSVARTLTLYAPTSAGTSGYLLQSNGSGEPSWRRVSDSVSPGVLISSNTNIPTVRDIYYGLPYINGTHQYNSNTYIYAPITEGTPGQILQSDGSGAPIWVDASSIGGGGSSFSLTLNGNSVSSATIYAPTTAGTSGYVLQSNGSGEAPTWRQVSDSSSASALTSSSTAIPTVRDIYNGLPYINGSHSYTRSTYIYAPISIGTAGQILRSAGNSTPVWATLKLYQHNIIVTSTTSNIGLTCTIINNSSSIINTEAKLKQWLNALGATDYWKPLKASGIYESYVVVGISNTNNNLRAHYFQSSTVNAIRIQLISSPTIQDTVAEIDLF